MPARTSSSTTAPSEAAWPPPASVEAAEARDEQQVDQALVEVGHEAADHPGAEEQLAGRVDQPPDPLALGGGHAEHLRLLGDPDRLADPAGVLHLRLRERARAARAERAQRAQQPEQRDRHR